MKIDKDKKKVIILLVLTMVILTWTLVNADGFIVPAFLYISLGALSIFLIIVFDNIGSKTKFIGLGKNTFKLTVIGLASALGVYFLQSLNLIGSVLIPYIPASLVQDVGRISIIVIGAGVVESVFFFGLILPIIDEKLKDFGINPPFLLALVILSVLFAFFHYSAYNQTGAELGSYISAGIVAFGWGILYKTTKSLTPLIASHLLLNFLLLNMTFHYLSIGM